MIVSAKLQIILFMTLDDIRCSSIRLRVRLVPEKTCFVALPSNLASRFVTAHRLPLALQLDEVHPAGLLLVIALIDCFFVLSVSTTFPIVFLC